MKNFLNHTIFQIITEVCAEEDMEAYVVGGFVRDRFLGRDSKDIDIVVVGDGIEMAQKVARKIRPGLRVVSYRNFGTAMFRFHGMEIEFAASRKESYKADSRKPKVYKATLEEDIQRRDFTINAMAIGLHPKNHGQLIDPFNGQEDLQKRIIRTPLDPIQTFSDDPLRMIRAIRFATQLNFRIEERTLNGIRENAERLKIISAERISEELNKILQSDKPSVGFRLHDSTGLLPIFLPELSNLHGVEAIDGRMHKDNFQHTLMVLDNVAGVSKNIWLRWAALLHDIAKPVTKKYIPEQGWTFHGHEYLGAKMVPGIFRRLRLPMGAEMRFVQKMVALHLRPIVLASEDVTDSAVRRLLFEAGDDIDQLMTLCEADITSKNDRLRAIYKANFALVRKKLKEIEEKDAVRNFQPPVTGEDIMKYFGIPPCREVGIIKNAIKEAILDGVIRNNREEAWQFMLEKGKELGLTPGTTEAH